MNKEITVVKPPNVGWIEYKLNNQEMDYVWRCIENKKDNCNSSLAGNITASYNLMDRGDWFWINTLHPLINCYTQEFGNSLQQSVPTSNLHPLRMSRWWVNYQKQNEFNPIHNHNGIYSFVIWMKLPKDIGYKKQNRIKISKNSNFPSVSAFAFLYNDILGDIQDHPFHLEPEDEGRMLLFPSQLRHVVYPFYNCDEERVSVSGNIALNSDVKT